MPDTMLNTDFIEFLRVTLEVHSTNATEASVNTRMFFWDGVLKALPSQYVQAA